MTSDSPDWEDDFTEDDVTEAASSDAVAEIRADAARRRSKDGRGDTGDTVDDEAITVIRTWSLNAETTDVGEHLDPGLGIDPTVVMVPIVEPGTKNDLGDDPTEVSSVDASSLMTNARTSANTGVADPRSLTAGKQPPLSNATFWERNEIGVGATNTVAPGRREIPWWFLAATVLAVVAASATVVLLLTLISGGSS